MPEILLLIPPNKEGFIRDTYYGCWHKRKFINYSWPPLYLYQLNSIIKNSKIVDLSELSFEYGLNYFKNAKNLKFIVCNIGTFTFKEDLMFLKEIKKITTAKIIVFGQHPTVEPEETLKSGTIDFALRGEPENIINDIINNKFNKKELKKINGVCFGKHISKKTVIINDLNSIPFPKRIKNKRYYNPLVKNIPYTTMLLTRGCPFDCIFCTVPTLFGKTFRKRSIESVILEIRQVLLQGYKEIFIRDENLTLDKKYLKNLCNEIINENLKFTWICNSRVDTVDYDLLKLMKKSGCHLIKFGVESGNQKTLNLLRKGITLLQIKNTFRICKKISIDTLGHFMIGSPGETRNDILNTIKFAIDLDPTYASFDVLIYYPKSNVNLQEKSKLSVRELNNLHDYAFRKFYLRPIYILKNILKTKTIYELINKFRATFQLWRGLIKSIIS